MLSSIQLIGIPASGLRQQALRAMLPLCNKDQATEGDHRWKRRPTDAEGGLHKERNA